MSQPASGRMEAHTTQVSGPPGTRLGIKASTSQDRYRVHAYRIGAYDGGTGALVWKLTTLPRRTAAGGEVHART